MNDKENLKVAVIESCINGTMTIKVAADRLKFSERYVKKFGYLTLIPLNFFAKH